MAAAGEVAEPESHPDSAASAADPKPKASGLGAGFAPLSNPFLPTAPRKDFVESTMLQIAVYWFSL